MKKFTLIEQDRYIGIDGVGIFFEEDNWPFVDIENLWAIQWRDNETEDGNGWVEYDSPIPNTKCTRADIIKYIDHFDVEYERQTLVKREQEEESSRQNISWQTAMKELEEQMENMQKNHEEALIDASEKNIHMSRIDEVKKLYNDRINDQELRHKESIESIKKSTENINLSRIIEVKKLYNDRINDQELRHKESIESIKKSTGDTICYVQKTVDEAQKRHEDSLQQLKLQHDEQINNILEHVSEVQSRHLLGIDELRKKHDYQMDQVHSNISETHKDLFYSAQIIQDNIEESKLAFQSESGYDKLTIFDGDVDPSLFDESIDESFFNNEVESVEQETVDTLFSDENIGSTLLDDYLPTTPHSLIRDFSQIDLSVLDNEFNLELLFEDDPTEQVVNEIEELIKESESAEDS